MFSGVDCGIEDPSPAPEGAATCHHPLMDDERLEAPEAPLRMQSVTLRVFGIEDAAEVAEACSDPLIPKFTFMADGLSGEGARDWIQQSNERWSGGNARFAIVDSESGDFLGQVGMGVSWRQRSGEVYYWVARQARGRGVASMATGLVADWAFDVVGIERLFLLTHLENEASQRVAKRCGFTREGVLRAYEPFKGGRPDLVCWSLLPTDDRPW